MVPLLQVCKSQILAIDQTRPARPSCLRGPAGIIVALAEGIR